MNIRAPLPPASLSAASLSPASLSSDVLPRGFRYGAVRAGIKASGRPDLACAAAAHPVAAAAMFTSNRVVAAPVVAGRRHLKHTAGRTQAVLVNAGNANCATGQAGLDACQQMCAAAGVAFGCEPHLVFPSSTGVIGVPLPAEKIVAALPSLVGALGETPEHLQSFAEAIMTTDTRPKLAHAAFETRGKTVRIAGVAKGAGMICPRLTSALHATMLVYLFTDIESDGAALQPLLEAAVEESFNRISIDGDTSTNDTVLLLASGESGVALKDRDAREYFSAGLTEVCASLAKQIVDDGEGITHVVELRIAGAASREDALRVARSIAHSPLVKTAWAGNDPNWGRLLASIGNAGAAVDPLRIAVRFGDLAICERGERAAGFSEAAAHAYLQQREFTVHVDLGLGEGACRFWTTDLTAEYVHINADYST